jgi:hypothetical protein
MSTSGGQPLHPRPSGRGITGIDKTLKVRVGLSDAVKSDSSLRLALIWNDYLLRNIHNPIAMKARAATFLRIFWGMTAIKPSPKRTPNSVTRHKARDAPVNTDKGSFVLEVIMMAANCVLSPNSAKKIVPKVARKTFQSIAFPPQIVFCFIENASFPTAAVCCDIRIIFP